MESPDGRFMDDVPEGNRSRSIQSRDVAEDHLPEGALNLKFRETKQGRRQVSGLVVEL